LADFNAEKIHLQQDAQQSYGNVTESPYELRGGSPVDQLERGLCPEDILIGNGWLERGCAFWLVAQSGVGKSQAILQICTCWACGKGGANAFFLDPYDGRALRIVIIQNEDSRNDLYRQSCILKALGLTENEYELVRHNLWIETVRGKLGSEAINTIKKVLDLRGGCDILVLNPLSAYVKGDLTRTEHAVEFLYGQFSPLLDEYQCGGGAAHHTPKSTSTTQQRRAKWSSYDFMYSGAGSAVLTNYARAYMTMDPKGNSRVFDVRMAKRVEQCGWSTGLEMFRWEQRGDARLWVPASTAEVQSAQATSQKTVQDLLEFVPAVGEPIAKTVLEHKACKVGRFTQQEFRAVRDEALSESTPDDLRLYDWRIYNPNGPPIASVARVPQPDDQKPEAMKAQAKEAKRQAAAAAKQQKQTERNAKVVQLPSQP
jgi:hypothetical protein